MVNEIKAAVREEQERRRAWTLARMAAVVRVGRSEGWLPGDAQAIQVPCESIEIRDDDEIRTPMQAMAVRLELSRDELNVLWVLVSIELDPAVSRVAQLLVSPGMHDLDVQMIERLVSFEGAMDSSVLERLSALGLIELSTDQRVPLFRRAIRPADRVVDLARGRVTIDRELARTRVVSIPASSTRALDQLALQGDTLERVREAMKTSSGIVVASGAPALGRRTLLVAAANEAGIELLEIGARALANDSAVLETQLKAIARECKLLARAPLVRNIDVLVDERDTGRVALIGTELARYLEGPIFVTAARIDRR